MNAVNCEHIKTEACVFFTICRWTDSFILHSRHLQIQKTKVQVSVFCTSDASDKYLELKIKNNQGSNISVFQTELNKKKNAHNKSSIFTRQLFFNTFSWRLKTEGWSQHGVFLHRQNLNPSKFPGFTELLAALTIEVILHYTNKKTRHEKNKNTWMCSRGRKNYCFVQSWYF